MRFAPLALPTETSPSITASILEARTRHISWVVIFTRQPSQETLTKIRQDIEAKNKDARSGPLCMINKVPQIQVGMAISRIELEEVQKENPGVIAAIKNS